MDISIRNTTKNDSKVIAKNIFEMAHEISQETLPYENVLQSVEKILSTPEIGFYIVAQSNNAVIGSLLINYEWSDWRNGVYWWIQSIYVDKEHRNKGIYTKMYEHIKDISGDAKAIKLYTDIDNKTAQAAYEKLGMKRSNSIIYEAGK